MKNLKYSLSIVLLILVVISSCKSDKKNNESFLDDGNKKILEDRIEQIKKCNGNDEKKAIDQLNKELQQFFLPTPFEYADSIVNMADDSLTIKDYTQLKNPQFKVLVSDLIDSLFPPSQTTDYENYGMRVYPALINKGKEKELSYIICTSTNYNKNLECNYFRINPDGTLEKIDSSKAYLLWENFKINVLLNGHAQNSNNRKYRTSRYYDWLDLKSYLSANNYTNSAANFKLQFSYGFVSDSIANKLYRIYWDRAGNSKEDLTGFTVVLELFNSDGSVTNRCDAGNSNYTKGILEIGNPCPPRCKGEGLISNY